MRYSSVRIAGILILALSLLALVGCAEKTPEQKLMAARANYTATLGGWSVMEPIAADPAPMMDEEGAGEEAMEEDGEADTAGEAGEMTGEAGEMTDEAGEMTDEAGEMAGDMADEGMQETAMEEAGPELKSVLLDILIRNENQEKLAGITLDVSQANEAGDELRHWRIWVDTSSIERGPGTQIDYRLDEVEIVEGYGFHVEVRSPVDPAERSEYREFDDLP